MKIGLIQGSALAMTTAALLAASVVAAPRAGAASKGCETLDTLPLGQSIVIAPPPAGSFQPPLLDIGARPFEAGNGTVITTGSSTTVNSGRAGGSGTELAVNNLTLSVSRGFGQTLGYARLRFGEYGGNINLRINEKLINVGNFAAVNGLTVAGVKITVPSGGNGNDAGVLELSGPMHDQAGGYGQVAVGGQELWVDDICFKEM